MGKVAATPSALKLGASRGSTVTTAVVLPQKSTFDLGADPVMPKTSFGVEGTPTRFPITHEQSVLIVRVWPAARPTGHAQSKRRAVCKD
jgi:hypothetical protein